MPNLSISPYRQFRRFLKVAKVVLSLVLSLVLLALKMLKYFLDQSS